MRRELSATWRYSARRKASALAAGRNGSVALPTGSRAPSARRSIHGSTTDSGTMLRRRMVMVAIAIRSGSPWVYTASTVVRTRSPMTSSSTVSSLRPKCGDSASTPMASAPWATVCAQPLSPTNPRTSFSRRYQVAMRSPHSIILAAGTRSSLLVRSMHSASTSTENARRKTESVPSSPRPTVSPAAMPSPRPMMRSSYTPRPIQVASVGQARPSRMCGSGEPSMVVSSVVRSASGRSTGTVRPEAFTWLQ